MQQYADDKPKKILKKPILKDRKNNNNHQVNKLSFPPSKFTHIKTISQIGANPSAFATSAGMAG